MPIGILFWMIMILWFLFGLYWHSEEAKTKGYGVYGGSLLLFVVLGLLGWRVFGPVLQ